MKLSQSLVSTPNAPEGSAKTPAVANKAARAFRLAALAAGRKPRLADFIGD
jgi:hypothetical protein